MLISMAGGIRVNEGTEVFLEADEAPGKIC